MKRYLLGMTQIKIKIKIIFKHQNKNPPTMLIVNHCQTSPSKIVTSQKTLTLTLNTYR